MGDWKIIGQHVDISTNLISMGNGTTTYTVENQNTGEIKEVVVWSGDRDYELQQLGEKIGEGDFDE